MATEPASTSWEKVHAMPHYLLDWISVTMIAIVSGSMAVNATKGHTHRLHGEPSDPTAARISVHLLETTANYTVAQPHGPTSKPWVVITFI